MPCKSDYLEPTRQEKEFQRAARLLVYVCAKTGLTPEAWAVKDAENVYANDDRSVIELCAVLRVMDSKRRDALVYNARDRLARDLADWWEDHQVADLNRRREEMAQKKSEETRKKALSKLSKEERKALGV